MDINWFDFTTMQYKTTNKGNAYDTLVIHYRNSIRNHTIYDKLMFSK